MTMTVTAAEAVQNRIATFLPDVAGRDIVLALVAARVEAAQIASNIFHAKNHVARLEAAATVEAVGKNEAERKASATLILAGETEWTSTMMLLDECNTRLAVEEAVAEAARAALRLVGIEAQAKAALRLTEAVFDSE